MDIQSILMNYVRQDLMKGREMNLGIEDDLLNTGILDSLGILQLVTFVEERFGTQVPDEDVVFENFHTVPTNICAN